MNKRRAFGAPARPRRHIAHAHFSRHFPMQGNGAEMMRVACCLATEEGITVCCPVHDALLVEAGATETDAVVHRTQQIM